MVNSIKQSGDGLGLQITRPARAAGFVEEDEDNTATRLAKTRVHSFAGLLVVVDVDRVDDAAEATLVATAAKDTRTAYRAMDATVQIAGNGYQLQLPPCRDAGLTVGDSAPCQSAPGLLVITDGTRDTARLADDLVAIRREQRAR